MAYTSIEIDKSRYRLQEVDYIFGENTVPNWYNGIVKKGLDTVVVPNRNKQQLGLVINFTPTTNIPPYGIKISNKEESFFFIEDHAISRDDNYIYDGKTPKITLNGVRIHPEEENFIQCPPGDFRFKILLSDTTSSKVLIYAKPWV